VPFRLVIFVLVEHERSLFVEFQRECMDTTDIRIFSDTAEQSACILHQRFRGRLIGIHSAVLNKVVR